MNRDNYVKHRKNEYDLLRVHAFLMVFLGHFNAEYQNNRYLQGTSTFGKVFDFIVHSWTPKFGVCIFCILVGFFSARVKKNYIVKRYFYFLVAGLLINVVFYLRHRIAGLNDIAVSQVLVQSVLLDNQIFPTFWCIRDFFIGGVLSQLNGRARTGPFEVVLQILFFYMLGASPFICACLIGHLLKNYEDRIIAWIDNRTVQIVILVGIPLAINAISYWEGTNNYYLVNGIFACLYVRAFTNNATLRKIALKMTKVSSVLVCYMGMFLIHTTVYEVIGRRAFRCFSNPETNKYAFMTVLTICLLITMVLAIPINWLINKVCHFAGERCKARFNTN